MSSRRLMILNAAVLGSCLLGVSTVATAQGSTTSAKDSFAVSFRPVDTRFGVNTQGIATLSNGVVVTVAQCYRLDTLVAPFCLVLSKNGRVLKQIETAFAPRGNTDVIVAAYGVAVDSRDRIVMVGTVDCFVCTSGIALARYLPTGVLDRSFGKQGLVRLHPETNERTMSIAIDAQNRIIVAGNRFLSLNDRPLPPNWGLSVFRVLENGSFDATFGVGGGASVDFAELGYFVTNTAPIRHIHVGAEGQITVAAEAENRWPVAASARAMLVARLTSNGTLDESFGQGGRVLFQQFFAPIDVTVDAHGRTLIAGFMPHHRGGRPGRDVGVVALLPDGSLDSGFGASGLAAFDVPMAPAGMALQPDGRIVIGGLRPRGYGARPNKGNFLVVRIDADGQQLDTGFGTNGVAEGFVISDAEDVVWQGGVLLTREGRILVAGSLKPGDALDPRCRIRRILSVGDPYDPEIPRVYFNFSPMCVAVKAFESDGTPEPSLQQRRAH
jgi:uncharacterized delta-60 repeat protein